MYRQDVSATPKGQRLAVTRCWGKPCLRGIGHLYPRAEHGTPIVPWSAGGLGGKRSGNKPYVLIDLIHRCGLRGWHLHVLSIGSVFLCIGLWIRAKTLDQSERGNAERRALFVGLWPPMLWLMGDSVERRDSSASRRRLRFS